MERNSIRTISTPNPTIPHYFPRNFPRPISPAVLRSIDPISVSNENTENFLRNSLKHRRARRVRHRSSSRTGEPKRIAHDRQGAGRQFVMFIKYRLAGQPRRHRMTGSRCTRARARGSRSVNVRPYRNRTIKCAFVHVYVPATSRARRAVAWDELCP